MADGNARIGTGVLGVILAGGLARRMGGGDKPLLRLGGRTLLERVIERVRPQCACLVLNANGPAERFACFDLPVVPDSVPGQPGPLAGLLAAMDWGREERPDLRWVLSVAGDTPFLPEDLAARLRAAAAEGGAAAATAASGGRSHPVVGLWSAALWPELRRALVEEGDRRVGRFSARCGAVTVEWPADPIDPFFNVNTPEELRAAEDALQTAS